MSNFSAKSKDSIVPEEQQSCESSPKKDNIVNNYQKQDKIELSNISFAPNKCEKEDIFKANNWRKNLDELLSSEANVLSSIVQGPQKNTYLKEVKL